MRPMIRACLGLVLLLAGLLPGQEEAVALPSAPESRILDQARMFAREPGRLEEMSRRLSALADRTGFDVRVAVYDSLIGHTVSERAEALEDAWIGDGPGVVMVIEADSGRYALAWSPSVLVSRENGGELPMAGAHDLPTSERMRVEQRLDAMTGLEVRQSESVEALLGTLAGALDAVFVDRAAPPDPKRLVKTLVLGTGLLATVLLIGLLVGAMLRRGDRRRDEQLVFPEVTVGMRLGAPYGGGRVSLRNFGALSARKS